MNINLYRKKAPSISTILLNDIMSKYHKNLMTKSKSKKAIFWSALGIPPIFLYAFDIMPVFPQYVFAMNQKYTKIMEALEGKWEVPKELCADTKLVLSHALLEDIKFVDFPEPDSLLSFNIICMQTPTCYNFISKYKNINHFFIDIPSVGNNEVRLDYIKKQVEHLTEDIEKKFNTKFDEKKFKISMNYYMQLIALWDELLKLCKFSPCPVDGQDLFVFNIPCLVEDLLADNFNTMKMYVSLYNEVRETLEKNKQNKIPEEKIRIFWDAHTLYNKKSLIKNTLAKHGASVTISSFDILSTPISKGKDLKFSYPLTLDKLEKEHKNNELIKKYFNNYEKLSSAEFMAKIFILMSGFKRGIINKCKFTKEMIEDFNIDAIIMNMNHSCRAISLEQTQLMHYIKDELKKPILIINADNLDDRCFSMAQIQTRIESFLENYST